MDQYDDLDPEGSCMAQIQALVQSDYGESSQLTKVEKEPRKTGRTVNHDLCDSCGEGGDLLCCDRCPCAFHFTCCDPPLEEDEIPSGEWLCNECRCAPRSEGKSESMDYDDTSELSMDNGLDFDDADDFDKISPFTTLVKMSTGKNPSTFTLPPELTCNTYFPGDRKRKIEDEKSANKKASEFDDGSRLYKLCFACSRSSLRGEMVECDFCPLSFHLNCIMPPLTNKPSGMWMCPNHAEHAEPGIRDPRFSKRLKAYNELRNNISQHTVKMDFLDRVHRLRSHPDFERRQQTWKRKRQTIVPEVIKNHYENPPILQLPEHIKECLKPLPPYRLPVAPPTSQEQEEWLKSVVSLQCNIAKHLTSLSTTKTPDGLKRAIKSNPVFNHVLSTARTTASTTAGTTTTAAATTTKLVKTTTNNTAPMVKTTSLSKATTLGNPATKLVSSSVTNTNVTSFNRVVTTHTITSGGKTLTKPITILYASPSKTLAQQNGVASKHLALNNCLNKMPGEIKSGFKLETGTKTPSAKAGIVNDLKTLPNGTMKTKTVGEVTKAVSVASPGLSTSRSAAASNSASGPTKVIVLTNNSSSGLVTKNTQPCPKVTANSTGQSAAFSSSSATSPTVQRIVVSASPQKVLVTNSTPTTAATSPNAVNALCAVPGLDSLQESDLDKLDPRLVHVLAFQRLQQLIAQTTNKVNSTSTVSRKISFNNAKETVTLPQNVPRGKAMALLCPINGEGSSCPMIYKTLNIGQAPDMDVCLQNYGYCNYLSDKHCSVFYDEATKQYELLNYSEHGTYVDNVLYSCDFSVKPRRPAVTSARKLDPTRLQPRDKHAGDKTPAAKHSASRRTSGLGVQLVNRPCSCLASSSSLIGGSGAGWEGTATLHHGSYIKVGCLQFIFSIVNHARKPETSKKITADMKGS